MSSHIGTPEEAAKVNARSGPDAIQIACTWELWKNEAGDNDHPG